VRLPPPLKTARHQLSSQRSIVVERPARHARGAERLRSGDYLIQTPALADGRFRECEFRVITIDDQIEPRDALRVPPVQPRVAPKERPVVRRDRPQEPCSVQRGPR
jgi:hypothetical protein